MKRRMPATETVRMALSTLRSNRLRSLLTMVGIVIGNASVITLVGVGRGAQLLAEGQLNNLGANVLFVVPGNNDTRRRGVAFPKTLVLKDAEAIDRSRAYAEEGDEGDFAAGPAAPPPTAPRNVLGVCRKACAGRMRTAALGPSVELPMGPRNV